MKKTQKKLYIAYGSNMSLEQMYHRCPTAEPVGKGVLRDWALFFAGSQSGNYATIEKKHGKCVPITLWLISPEDEARLDVYEGTPTFYPKSTIEFEWADGRKDKGLVYIMRTDTYRGLPSIGYYSGLEEAYERYGFNKKILIEALENSDQPLWKGEEECAD